MYYLLQLLIAIPFFSTFVESEGSERFIDCFPFQNGYCAVATSLDDWGGAPQTVLRYLDPNGMPSGSYTFGGGGEPVSACALSDGVAVLSIDLPGNTTRLFFKSPSEEWTAEFPGQFTEGACIEKLGTTIYVAGNDLPGDSPVRLAAVNELGSVTMNQEYPSHTFDVADVTLKDGEVCILGGSEQPGWQRDIVILFPLSGQEYHYQPLPGRFSSVSAISMSGGYCILANAMTDENGLIGEVFVLKTTEEMTVAWTASLTGSSWISGADMIPVTGGFTAAGWSNSIPPSEVNRSDLLLFRYSDTGELVWSRLIGEGTPDYGIGIEPASENDLLVSGCTVDGLYNGWAMRTDSTGSLEPQGVQEEASCELTVSLLSSPAYGGRLSVGIVSGISGIMSVRVMDMSGRIVAVKTVNHCISDTSFLDFSGLPSGVYTVIVASDAAAASVRAVVLGGGR